MVDRAFYRTATEREVKLRYQGMDAWVRLYDLSAGGAMIETAGLDLAPGDQVELTFSDLVAMGGVVVWRIDGNVGIQFVSLMSDWMLERLGIEPSSRPFNEAAPRDRFGQLLARSGSSQAGNRAAGGEPSARVGLIETAIPVRLARVGGECEVGHLTSLACDRCRFAGPSGDFSAGDRILLHIGNLEEWPGIVRQAADGEVEIEFDRSLHPAVVEHISAANSSARE